MILVWSRVFSEMLISFFELNQILFGIWCMQLVFKRLSNIRRSHLTVVCIWPGAPHSEVQGDKKLRPPLARSRAFTNTHFVSTLCYIFNAHQFTKHTLYLLHTMYSWGHLVVPYTEELISRPFLDENSIRQLF